MYQMTLSNHYRTFIRPLLNVYWIIIERLSNHYWTSIGPFSTTIEVIDC